MTTNPYASTVFASRKRRTYSAELKLLPVKNPTHPSPQSLLVCKWILLLDGRLALHKSAPPKPTFIALPYPATFNPPTTAMLPVHIILPDSNIEIGLKWQVSEMLALAELLKVQQSHT
ncbi:MAG: hypothetical protein B7Z24_07795 [Pseudomonadales bacterium 32-42-5]|jgi:transposase|nr:MAG: hypothetical protein B7Z24_07795 [Pseudomonadales bacterium 32-42-5]